VAGELFFQNCNRFRVLGSGSVSMDYHIFQEYVSRQHYEKIPNQIPIPLNVAARIWAESARNRTPSKAWTAVNPWCHFHRSPTALHRMDETPELPRTRGRGRSTRCHEKKRWQQAFRHRRGGTIVLNLVTLTEAGGRGG